MPEKKTNDISFLNFESSNVKKNDPKTPNLSSLLHAKQDNLMNIAKFMHMNH